MAERTYKYKAFIEKGFDSLNRWDFDALFSPGDFSPTFTKYLLPQSMSAAPQTREQWREDLTTGFVAQNYKEWKASIAKYWEDVEGRSAIAWCSEKGVLVDGSDYEMDYMMRYEFDERGRLERLWEYTDSKLQDGIFGRWMERLGEAERKREEDGKRGQCDRLYLLTYPRTASNLLVRILALEDQPKVKSRRNGGYFFLPSVRLTNDLKLRGKAVEDWTQDEREQMMQSYQRCFDELEDYVTTATGEGKIAFVKEHCCFMTEPTAQTRYVFSEDSVRESAWTVQLPSTYASKVIRSSLNETVLPDDFLKTWLPTFLIRHPALVFPSHYRATMDIEGIEVAKTENKQLTLIMTLHWTRSLYDWYAQHLNKAESGSGQDVTWPLVLDADDVMTDPEVVIRFCDIVGLDSSKLKFTWPAATSEELSQFEDDVERRMLSTLSASAGVVEGKTSANLDIGMEAKKWREEFGQHAGEKMEKWVRAAMPDYDFMKARRLRSKTP